jgi:iron-sulfur cluster assembly protein/iron-sulfur cluster insertion protein
MITLSEGAAAEIRRLQSESAAEGQLLRIFVETGGCSGLEYGMSFAEPKDDDAHLESQGVSFQVDRGSLERLQGSEVHFDDGLGGKGFEVRNPNAKSTCGCGRSFN